MDAEFAQKYIGMLVGGRFKIEAPIAAGGMGLVFRAQDVEEDRPVAVKVLRYSLDREVFQRFEREARVIASFDHPNLVKMYDSGMAGELPYLALEFVEGISLGQVLMQGRLSVRATSQMGVAIASALQHAHEKGVIHRDLKPDNILIREVDGHYHAKLVDFGVAHAVSDQSNITQAGSICGTPGYVSPEQIRGQKVTVRSDLYSFGIVLFESLTGTRAFPGTVPMQILVNQASGSVPSLSSFPSLEVPDALIELVLELLDAEPEKRPSSAGEVAAKLSGFAGGVPTDSTDQIAVPTDKFERVESEQSISIPIRVGGGWDALLSGKVAEQPNGGVIDPQLFDVNPREIDVSFEFTSMERFTRPESKPGTPSRVVVKESDIPAGGWIDRPPIAREDYSNLSLARPIRDPEEQKTVYRGPGMDRFAPIIFVVVILSIFLIVVALFYWRGKVKSSTMPEDVVQEAIHGPADLDKIRRKEFTRPKKIRKTPKEGTPENPIELFDE